VENKGRRAEKAGRIRGEERRGLQREKRDGENKGRKE
jgi:hypothetical protein